MNPEMKGIIWTVAMFIIMIAVSVFIAAHQGPFGSTYGSP